MVITEPTILVVDDDAETQTIFKIFLSKMQVHCLIANHYKEALDYIERYRPTVVLLDIMLPGMNGIELLTTIRNTPQIANTYIVMISAHDFNSFERPDGIEPDAILRKPITIPQLREVLALALA
ncbi:MAG: response regulator [Phototrophicaceae bacterium]|jgi:CheY-like chemotaxis protein